MPPSLFPCAALPAVCIKPVVLAAQKCTSLRFFPRKGPSRGRDAARTAPLCKTDRQEPQFATFGIDPLCEGRGAPCQNQPFAARDMFWRRGALQKSAHCCRRPIWAGLFLAEIGRLLQRACLGGEGSLHLSVLCCKRHPCIRGWRFCFCHPYMSGHHRSHGHAGRSAVRPASALVPSNRSHSPASRPAACFRRRACATRPPACPIAPLAADAHPSPAAHPRASHVRQIPSRRPTRRPYPTLGAPAPPAPTSRAQTRVRHKLWGEPVSNYCPRCGQ